MERVGAWVDSGLKGSFPGMKGVNSVMPPRCLTSVKKSQQNELVVTYSQASRGLLWTEFVPKHKAEEELKRSENSKHQ